MLYGATKLRWAPIVEEPAGALPTYGQARELGELNRLSDNPTYNEAKAYGNNALRRHVNKFKEVPIDVTILDISNENASAITGAAIAEEAGQDLVFGVNDNAPYGGLSFYVNELLEGNVDAFKGIYYPKAKANMQGQEYTTMGENITLAAKTLRFLGAAANNGQWKVESKYFTTEAEADAWAAAKLAGEGAGA